MDSTFVNIKKERKMKDDLRIDSRISEISRKTSETSIEVKINLDGKGRSTISTGIGFFDHMLTAFANHGLFDLTVEVQGDLQVDCHHTIEDTGIALGQAISKALTDKSGINRFGNFILPMDEALVLCAIDLSGRPYLVFDCEFTTEWVGEMKTEMIKEFFYALSNHSGMNLHLKVFHGSNNHHIAEALFKGFGRGLAEAIAINPRMDQVWSTKGSLSEN
jgi:imidazoleglycerol-phosphate dehydratase